MGSRLPNHDAKGWKERIKETTKKNKRVDCIREGQSTKILTNNNLYDA